MLSEFMFPCTYPTLSQPAVSAACRAAKARTTPTTRCGSGAAPSTSAANSLRTAASKSCSSMRRASAAVGSGSCSPSRSARREARREWSSRWPTRRKEGAARQVIAQRSVTSVSGGWSLPPRSPSLYHILRTRCVDEATSERARVVGMPRWCIASETRYSRTLERSTARPSPPREKGVVPAPLSCSSHRDPPPHSTSPSDTARPSPYPLPRPNGSGAQIGLPKTETA
mmetsp:Transcript_786/g.2787  ORF Transcript_786/g.2787 Transcript_786/m.2787 type:complete len:227 (+) Transcript_786:611-1291(+)